MKKYLIIFLILPVSVIVLGIKTDLWAGSILGGYGAEIVEKAISPFYLSESLSIAPDAGVISLNQGVGSDFTLSLLWFSLDFRAGLAGSLLLFKGGSAALLWIDLKSSLLFSNFGIFGGVAYEIAGFNAAQITSSPNLWVPEFGIGYTW